VATPHGSDIFSKMNHLLAAHNYHEVHIQQIQPGIEDTFIELMQS